MLAVYHVDFATSEQQEAETELAGEEYKLQLALVVAWTA